VVFPDPLGPETIRIIPNLSVFCGNFFTFSYFIIKSKKAFLLLENNTKRNYHRSQLKNQRKFMKICTIIGARPQFVKAAAVSAEIAKHEDLEEVIVHTGQHYDPSMSDIFFEELKIPREKHNLAAGSGLQGEQTGKMMQELEKVLIEEKPDRVLIYGDTNSTLAGAVVAVKLHIPVVHVEAGMRSFNRRMPEEINRVISDHVCQLNLCSTSVAMENLENEGRSETAELVGDVMYDCALMFSELAEKYYKPLEKFDLESGKFVLMTCHRAENTNDRKRLENIVEAVNEVAEDIPVLYPMHPRTVKYLRDYGLSFSGRVKTVEPVSYLEMILLEKSAGLILTDSGGVQKEAFFYQVPCVTMRDETEWVETVELGWNWVVGADTEKIVEAVTFFLNGSPEYPTCLPYGDGKAAEKIVEAIKNRDLHV
jgi:UDP-GlcNAc3NAcA epimerase